MRCIHIDSGKKEKILAVFWKRFPVALFIVNTNGRIDRFIEFNLYTWHDLHNPMKDTVRNDKAASILWQTMQTSAINCWAIKARACRYLPITHTPKGLIVIKNVRSNNRNKIRTVIKYLLTFVISWSQTHVCICICI